MSPGVRIFLLAGATPLAALLLLLGVETCRANLLGWFLVFIGASYLLGGVIYLWNARSRPTTVSEEKGDRSFWMLLPGFLVVFYGSPLEYLLARPILPRLGWLQAFGAALVLAGAGLFAWGRRALQDYFNGHVQIAQGHRLVQTGPFRWIRHPAYAGYLLIMAGVAVGYSSLVGLLAVPLLLAPGLVYRIQIEERLLSEHFGGEYRRFAARTRRLIPGIW